MTAPTRKVVNIYTEADAVQDFKEIANHVIDRANGMRNEIQEFGKLFGVLETTYSQYRKLADDLRDTIVVQNEYDGVPDYHNTAIHKGCASVASALEVMGACHENIASKVSNLTAEISTKIDEIEDFAAVIIPESEHIRDGYANAETELQEHMDKYMKAAEANHPAFFIIARKYRENLVSFHQMLKFATANLQDILRRTKEVEQIKRDFEKKVEQMFVEEVLKNQDQIRAAFNNSLAEMKELSGIDAWEVLASKLRIFKDDKGTTIFDDPVPNKSAALIQLWMERDTEMTARAMIDRVGRVCDMVVTRWGFVQFYNNVNEEGTVCEFYIYDYVTEPTPETGDFRVVLKTRIHESFAPAPNGATTHTVKFEREESKDIFVKLVEKFQLTHGAQT